MFISCLLAAKIQKKHSKNVKKRDFIVFLG